MIKIFFIAFMSCSILSYGQSGNDSFAIEGKLGTVSPSAKVYLQYMLNGVSVTDSSLVRNGRFEFHGTAPVVPVTGSVRLNEQGTGPTTNDVFFFFIEKGLITLVSDSGRIASAKVGGSPTNIDYSAYKSVSTPFNELYANFTSRLKNASTSEKETSAFKSKTLEMEKALKEMNRSINSNFLLSHPNSFLSLQILNSLAYVLEYREVQSLFDSLSAQIKKSPAGEKFAQQLSGMKSVSIGSIAPGFSLPDTSGKTISLSDFRGKYVLIDLWASWCGPCRAENPNLVRTYENFKDKNFSIIGVSLDRPGDRKQWLAAIQNDGLTWTQVSDLQFWNSQVAKAYGVTAIPQNFLIDPSGKVIAKGLRGKQLDEKLIELFGAEKNGKSR